MKFEEAFKEEYGMEVETLSEHVAPAYFRWTGRIRLRANNDPLTLGNRWDLFKIMDDEDIIFLYKEGDFIISIYDYDVFQGAILKKWGEPIE